MKARAVLTLLQHGADPKITDNEGRTPRDEEPVALGRDSFAVAIRTHLDNAADIYSEYAMAQAAKAKAEL